MANQHKERIEAVRDALNVEARGTSMCQWCAAEASQGETHESDCPVLVFEGLVEQLEAQRKALAFYADLDTWKHVSSPETGSAWEKVRGHPTPWVDAQHDLDDGSNPATTSSDG